MQSSTETGQAQHKKYLYCFIDVKSKSRCMAYEEDAYDGKHQGHHCGVSSMPLRDAVMNPGGSAMVDERKEADVIQKNLATIRKTK